MIPAPAEKHPTVALPRAHAGVETGAPVATPLDYPRSSAPLALRAWLAQESQGWPALAVLLLAAAGLGLFSLLRTPPPFVDEAWYAARAWALLETGRAFGVLDAGVFERYDGYWTYFPWLGTWLQAQAIRLMGLNLFAVRLTSLAFGLLLLAGIYAIGRQLGGRWLGLLATALVALSSAFVYSSHLARQDIMVAALGYGAIALYLADLRPRLPIRSMLAGLLVGLASEIHPNALIFAPAIAALLLVDGGWATLRSRRLWGFVAGLALGLGLYAALHILPYPQTYATLTALVFSSSHTPPPLVRDPGVWVESLLGMGLLWLAIGDVRVPVVLAALVVLRRTRCVADQKLLVLFGALFLAFLTLVRNKLLYYGVLISPAADLLVAALLVRLFHAGWGASRWRQRLAALVLGLVIPSMTFSLAPMFGNPMDEYEVVIDRLAASVAPDSVIMGSQTYWLGLPKQRYLSWQQVVYYRRAEPGSSLEDALRALHPDVLIVDEHMELFIVDGTTRLSNYTRSLALPRGDLERFLNQQAQLVTLIPSRTFGMVRVYKIDWQRSALTPTVSPPSG